MSQENPVNILLVDDQPGKLLTYEAMLHDLGENLLRAGSGREALEHLLKTDVAVILVDVCMPDLDGFQLAAMIREHPRFQRTAMIFISAIHLSDMDRLRGYEMGAVDYVPVPVIPEVLRAKVRVFCELYRKTRALEMFNVELEERVAQRTAELAKSTAQLQQSERRRSLALAAANMGSWEWNKRTDEYVWDEGQYRIFGVSPGSMKLNSENIRSLVHPDDWTNVQMAIERFAMNPDGQQIEFRAVRPDGEIRWCVGSTAAPVDGTQDADVVSGVTLDITERKEADERQILLAREVDHRAKNALALVQSIVRLTKANNQRAYIAAVEGRIRALSQAHNMLALSRWQGASLSSLMHDEIAPYRTNDPARIVIDGEDAMLQPAAAQTLALALHELATNAAKYGALSVADGRLHVSWKLNDTILHIYWRESGGPLVQQPTSQGFGSRIIKASVERQLGGKVEFDWDSAGLGCHIQVPSTGKTGIANPVDTAVRRTGPASGREPRLSFTGNRIMIVEDEALVAMTLAEAVAQLGFEVVGPFANLKEARRVVLDAALDAAILDINISGELIYPVAELLLERKLPFIFVTGYGAESIDARFCNVPALQKPIEREMLGRIFAPQSRSRAAAAAAL